MRKSLKLLLAATLAVALVGPAATAAAAEKKPAKPIKQKVNIVAMDYHYMGVKKELKNVYTRFTFENEGEQSHMAIIIKMFNGKKLKELLKMPDKKVMKHIKVLGDFHAGPGKASKKKLDVRIRKGRYAMLCFVQDDGESPPHFELGMIHRFMGVEK